MGQHAKPRRGKAYLN